MRVDVERHVNGRVAELLCEAGHGFTRGQQQRCARVSQRVELAIGEAVPKPRTSASLRILWSSRIPAIVVLFSWRAGSRRLCMRVIIKWLTVGTLFAFALIHIDSPCLLPHLD